jgi:molybdopterin-guanine dinucleotide biosynthesis protein A
MAKSKLWTEVTGVVIAGGRSTRMGSRDKALIELAGRPMIGHVIDRMRPQVGRLTINANGDPSRFARFELPVVPDTIEDWPGPLAGLLAALEWARRETPEAGFVASVAADTPFLPEDLVARLLAAIENERTLSAIAASDGTWTPIVGVWSVALADELAEALRQGVRAVHRFATAQKSAVVDFPPVQVAGESVDPFFNVNTPEDLERVRALLSAETARG